MSLTVGSLFSGVGGFDLGLECAGMEVTWQVENDKWCRQVLRARWSNVKLYGDVKDVMGTDSVAGGGCKAGKGTRKPSRSRESRRRDVHPSRDEKARRGLDGEGEDGGRTRLAPVDLICGGFPCQDLSVAGRRAGLAGERSGLFFEFVRIAREVSPRWILVENVPGLLSSNGGDDFALVLRGLTGFWPQTPDGGWRDAGCCEGPRGRAFWRVLDTQYFGPPQRRRRVFVVVDTTARCGPEVLLEPSCVPGHPAARGATWKVAPTLPASGAGTSRPGGPGLGSEEKYVAGWRGGRVAGTLPSRSEAGGFPGTDGACDGHVTAFNATQNPAIGRKAGALSGQGAACYPDLRRHNDRHRGGKRERPSLNATNNDLVYPTLRENWRNNSNPSTEARMLVHENLSGSISRRRRATSLREGASHSYQFVEEAVPRRLTPTECERLQGFPDDWTATGIDADGEPTEISDTQRYKQMGNAVSVPVAAWIGARIVAAEMGAIRNAA